MAGDLAIVFFNDVLAHFQVVVQELIVHLEGIVVHDGVYLFAGRRADRRSVRAYKDLEVESDKIDKILEAGRLSPSANNRQEWKFIVVKNTETKKKLARAAMNQSFIGQTPVVLVACATESKAVMTCGHPTYAVDLSIAFAYMLLQVYELGLGTCWIGAFSEDEVKSVIGVPKHVRVVALSPFGYPATDTVARSRKSLDEITCFEVYR